MHIEHALFSYIPLNGLHEFDSICVGVYEHFTGRDEDFCATVGNIKPQSSILLKLWMI